jgi:hypothetical protein
MKHLLIVALFIFHESHDIFGQPLQVSMTDINYAGDTTVSHQYGYLPATGSDKDKYPAVDA